MAPSGRVYYFGIPDDLPYPLNLNRFLRKHLTLQAGLTTDHRHMLATADRYLQEHPLLAHALVTDVYPVNQINKAFACAESTTPGRLKVTLAMQEGIGGLGGLI